MNRSGPDHAAAWLRLLLPALIYLALRWALGRALALAWAPLADAAALALLPAALWAHRRGGAPRPRLHPPAALLGALCGAALGLLTACLPGVADAAAPRGPIGLVALCIAGPLCEETVYRGMVLRRAGAMLPAWAALAISAALFAAGHGTPPRMAAALFAGLAFGGVYLRGEACRPGAGLPAAALCHMAANLIPLLRR